MRHVLAITLLLFLSEPSLGERIPFLVETDPPGASVVDGFGNELPRSGEQGFLETEKYGSEAEFTVQLDGYKPQTFYVRIQTLRSTGRYPAEGPLVLSPTSRLVPVKRFLAARPIVSFLALAAIVSGLLGIWKLLSGQRKQMERLAILAQFEEGTSKQDSLLMKVVGGYRLVDVLGKGGMATVYRGVPESTLNPDEAVAVKVLSQDQTVRDDFQERFRREVQVYMQLSHPNIVQLIDWGTHDGWTFLVLQLVDGEELGERAPSLSYEELTGILASVMRAMAFAHAQGIVHRDLKPENIMLTPQGKVMVMDFGLARKEDAQKITQTGAALGTPAYMAPEQIQAGPLDPRTDQYGIGVMAFELLTGQLPFEHEDAIQVIFSHLSARRPDPCEINSKLPPALGQVVQRMMAIDPDDRYPSLSDAHDAFLAATTASVETA
jgi:hypothetical protein